ncbi:MAG: hypothetical protein WC860_01895 [Candidatus Margulisiibacteriota bacterium]
MNFKNCIKKIKEAEIPFDSSMLYSKIMFKIKQRHQNQIRLTAVTLFLGVLFFSGITINMITPNEKSNSILTEYLTQNEINKNNAVMAYIFKD